MTLGPSDVTPPVVLSHWKESVATQSRKEPQATGFRAEHRKLAEPQESSHPCLLGQLDEWTVLWAMTKEVYPSTPA